MDVLCTFKIKIVKIWIIGISKTSDHIQIKIKMPNPSQEPPASSKAPNEDIKDMDVSKSRYIPKFWNMGGAKTSDYIQTKIKVPNLSQEPPVSSKAQNEDFNDMDVLCTFKIRIESQNLDHGCIKHL